MFFTYILKSEKTGRLYKGHTKNLELRIEQHNSGKTKSTKHGIPWKLIYHETFETRKEAIERERFLKTGSGYRFIKSLNLF